MRKKHITWQWLSVVLLVIMVFAVPAIAGNLNPSAPPAPTMKTLDQAPAKDEVIPPWSQRLPANDTGDPCNSARFQCVMVGGAAVLDKETGLVWERTPDNIIGNIFPGYLSWKWAHIGCNLGRTGNRGGWRLPTFQELASLEGDNGTLPSGHPFNVPLNDYFWSATTDTTDATRAWAMFTFGSFSWSYVLPKTEDHNAWCVRGGHGSDTH